MVLGFLERRDENITWEYKHNVVSFRKLHQTMNQSLLNLNLTVHYNHSIDSCLCWESSFLIQVQQKIQLHHSDMFTITDVSPCAKGLKFILIMNFAHHFSFTSCLNLTEMEHYKQQASARGGKKQLNKSICESLEDSVIRIRF